MKYIKSPLNYTGGKYKLLSQIIPLFPNDINRFIDLFTGGTEVGINTNAKSIVCNDILTPLIDLLNFFNDVESDKIVAQIENIIRRYGLSETNVYGYEYYRCSSNSVVGSYNKAKYMKLRDDYNNSNRSPVMFYTLIIFAFNNMIRFNDEGKFNVAVNKRDFNNSMRKKLIDYVNHIKKLDIAFTNKDFRDIKTFKLLPDDFVYCDPPYLITLANYNERNGWTEQDEVDLYGLLDDLHRNNIRFALSNVLESKGKSNDILKEWSKKYTIYKLNYSYKNCNYQKKDKSEASTMEVLVTNY